MPTNEQKRKQNEQVRNESSDSSYNDKKNSAFTKGFWITIIGAIILFIILKILPDGSTISAALMACLVVLYPVFMIVDLFIRHRHEHKILLRFFGEVAIFAVAFLTLMLCVNFSSSNSSDDSSPDNVPVSSNKKVVHSQNLPGQEIDKTKATKHEFYWTSNSEHKERLFVNNDKKITTIKYIMGNDQNNTIWCQAILSNILHDDHLKYGNDKQKEENTLLSNKNSYNIYSPQQKKWYWVRFDAGDSKNMVADFAIYPGKSSEAK